MDIPERNQGAKVRYGDRGKRTQMKAIDMEERPRTARDVANAARADRAAVRKQAEVHSVKESQGGKEAEHKSKQRVRGLILGETGTVTSAITGSSFVSTLNSKGFTPS